MVELGLICDCIVVVGLIDVFVGVLGVVLDMFVLIVGILNCVMVWDLLVVFVLWGFYFGVILFDEVVIEGG